MLDYFDDLGCCENPSRFADDFNIFEENQITLDREGDEDREDYDEDYDEDDYIDAHEVNGETPMGNEIFGG